MKKVFKFNANAVNTLETLGKRFNIEKCEDTLTRIISLAYVINELLDYDKDGCAVITINNQAGKCSQLIIGNAK